MKTNCRVCAECGATFTAYTTRAKYCSTNCSKTAAARKKSTKAAENRQEAINATKERRNKNGNLKNNSKES